MDIPVFACAFIAVIFMLIGVVLDYPLAYLYGKYWRRTKIMHTSTQPAQIHFALQEGQNIVGVIDTTKVICFYIDNDRRDAKPYE
jgi:hypothetical protein